MALVKCEGCGAQASNEAGKCPKCGFRLEHIILKAIKGVCWLIVIGFFLYFPGFMIWGMVTA
jgi:uncharacterized paraquat-inducible protein A